MNRCERDREFEDVLGWTIHWTLRAEFGDAQPNSDSWCRLEERVAALERERAARASRFTLLRRLLGRAQHLFDDNVLAAEAPWSPAGRGTYFLADERPMSPWSSPWPAYGQMMSIW